MRDMYKWSDFEGANFIIEGKRKKVCNNIFTFDIETTSILKLGDKIISASEYQKLSKESQEKCEFLAFMYIWQFSIDDQVYYGRTWDELKKFWNKLNKLVPERKIVFVHNLSFEFQFLCSNFNVSDVLARKSRHVMKCEIKDFSLEFRCSYMMSNVALKILAKTYKLPIEKLVGDLDYSILRNSKTSLSETELKYCENDCLIVYYYIKMELERYKRIDKIPITYTGHVRREFRDIISKDWIYRRQVYKAINVDGHIYNLLTQAFQGGYTHSNWFYTSQILENIDSYDFTSSYPFVMVSEKYPSTEFVKTNIKRREQMMSRFAYILVVRFKNIKSKYYNNFISFSKCRNIRNGRYDNGRVVSADELEITLTDLDFNFILESYSGSYEIIEAYMSLYKYLPKTYINFILEKYVEKTKLKNVEGQEVNYTLAKNSFNSLYGMSVTNTIRDEVIFEDGFWSNRELSNTEIIMKLQEEKSKSFLSFAYGVWVTAYGRRNLLKNVLKLDDFIVYCDTDSLKLIQGYNKKIIEEYNNSVIKKLRKVSEDLEIDFEKFSPLDIKGNKHCLGLFEKEYTSKENKDFTYKEFITQGAKKYAYRTMDGDIKITVSGVPKCGAASLKNDLRNFTDGLIFPFEETGKNMLIYNDMQESFILEDYQGNKEEIKQKTGACIVPATYELGKSIDYTNFISEESSSRSIYKE